MLKTAQHIILKDERRLGFAEYGTPEGSPIVYCHGSQSSRLEMHYDHSFAEKNNLRILAVDRPGHGLSDMNSEGSILDFARDVKQVTEHLNIDTFSVAGMSAGAPFALGIAYLYPKNVCKAGIISGFAPFSKQNKKHLTKEVKFLLNVAKSAPYLLCLLLKTQTKSIKKNPLKSLQNFTKSMSKPDQKVLQNDAVIAVMGTMFQEAFRNGSAGVAHEICKLLLNDWGFKINEIKVPVHFWQGEQDKNVPFEWAQYMYKQTKNGTLTSFSDEGHLIIFKHAEEIFRNLKHEY